MKKESIKDEFLSRAEKVAVTLLWLALFFTGCYLFLWLGPGWPKMTLYILLATYAVGIFFAAGWLSYLQKKVPVDHAGFREISEHLQDLFLYLPIWIPVAIVHWFKKRAKNGVNRFCREFKMQFRDIICGPRKDPPNWSKKGKIKCAAGWFIYFCLCSGFAFLLGASKNPSSFPAIIERGWIYGALAFLTMALTITLLFALLAFSIALSETWFPMRNDRQKN